MYRTIIRHHFDSAHLLESHKGKCNKLHGHRWYVEMAFEFEELDPETNMTIDFTHLKNMLYELCSDVDHDFLNEVFEIENPTAEFLAKWFYDEMKKFDEEFNLLYVAIEETPTNRAEYRR